MAERQAECRNNINNDACTATITDFCGAVGTANTGVLFDPLCAGAGYAPERQTECRNDIDNGDCTATIVDFCGLAGSANAGALFDDLCAGAGYVAERQTECRNNGSAQDGAVGGKCETAKTAFCDGGQISDNPYADVCGDNTVNQQRFCGLANNADAPNCPATISLPVM